MPLRNSMPNRSLLVATLVAAFAIPAAATAAESFPRIEASVPIEIEDDWNYRSDDSTTEHNQIFTKIEPEATIHLSPGLRLFGHAVIEPVRDPEARKDRAFEDHGVFVEDLYVEYEFGRYALRGGKFTPAFGVGWDITPGIWGTDFAEAGYELAERIGVSARARFADGRGGDYALTAHGFFLDTTVLSESTGRGRGTTDRSDGGVSNTGDPSSWVLTLDGDNLAGVEGLAARLAYVRQAPGKGDNGDEKGVSVALWHRVALGPTLSFSPMIEFVVLDDMAGVADQRRDFLTFAGRLDWKNWNVTLAHTARDTDIPAAADTEDF